MTIISEHKGVINFHLTRDGNELKIGSAKFNSVVYNSIWYQTLFLFLTSNDLGGRFIRGY